MLGPSGSIEPGFFEDDTSPTCQRDPARGLYHPDAAAELANLVCVVNCYYSNLIEGRDPRPKDVGRA
jgi:hypothetical protein